MQLIYKLSISAKDYVDEDYHLQIRPPEICPNCKKVFKLEAHGYYKRNVSGLNKYVVYLIHVRRFECGHCGITVSLLPSFCQPYRLICNTTIEDYFSGAGRRPEVVYWLELLQSYKRRFANWVSELSLITGNGLGVAPSIRDPVDWWSHIIKKCGCLGAATHLIVKTFKVSLFGRYRCHQRRNNVT